MVGGHLLLSRLIMRFMNGMFRLLLFYRRSCRWIIKSKRCRIVLRMGMNLRRVRRFLRYNLWTIYVSNRGIQWYCRIYSKIISRELISWVCCGLETTFLSWGRCIWSWWSTYRMKRYWWEIFRISFVWILRIFLLSMRVGCKKMWVRVRCGNWGRRERRWCKKCRIGRISVHGWIFSWGRRGDSYRWSGGKQLPVRTRWSEVLVRTFSVINARRCMKKWLVYKLNYGRVRSKLTRV